MRKIVVDSVRYHVEIRGKGMPMLLLHGFTGDSSTWAQLAENLCLERTCIMPDIVGHGKTDSPENGLLYEIENVANHLKKILDTLKVEQVDLLGYSMGGRLALAFAVKYPERVRRLILESASPGIKSEEERLERRQKDEQLAMFILEKGVRVFVDYWEKIPLFASQLSLSSITKKAIREQRLKNSPSGLANSLLYMGTGSQPSYWDELIHLPMEVLYIVGSLDKKFCLLANKMQQLTRSSQKVVVPQSGHAIHVENCEKFGTIVSEFLSKKIDRG